MEQYVLNEMYFGKLPGLLKIEDYFAKIQQKYKKSNMMVNLSAYRTLIKDPILMKIANELKDMFGFKEVAVTFARDDTFNAYTIPFVSEPNGDAYTLDEKRVSLNHIIGSVIITNSGFRFNPKKFPVNLFVCINLGCLFKSELTIPELMAVLLHEIGHNFSLVMLGNKMTPKANETHSDVFASMYGYGKELISAFSKFAIKYSDFDKAFKDIPVLNIVTGLNQIRKGIHHHDPEEDHPTIKVRLDNILRQMEADLKETPNLSPGMRQDLKNQIEYCKKLISDTYDSSDKDNIGTRMTKYYWREMEPGFETYQTKEIDKYAHPTKLNQKISDMMKPKGWFKL